MIKCTLDGIELEVEPGTTILKAARSLSVDIPTFCYHDRLSLSASCRMCLIEIDGRRKLEPACATAVAQDMVIHTQSEKVVQTRGDMLEILLANHPLDCPVCDKGGECELQDTVFEYGRGESRLRDPKRVFRTRDIELNDVIVFNANRCIQCQRCVRMCEEVVGEVALGTSERGLDSEITGVGNSLKDCSHCGNCIEVCPVGALMSTPYRYKARPWDLVKTETICGMCGTGCSLTVEMREAEFARVKSDPETGLNGELLCAKGRFGFDALDGDDRILTPMLRKDGALTPVTWDEALNFVAKKASEIRTRNGHIQGQISPHQTNETAFQFQQLMRQVFATNDINSSSRFNSLRDPKTVASLTQLVKNHIDRGSLKNALTADCVFLLGANTTEENPVTGYLIRAAMRHTESQLLIASSRPCGLDDIAAASMRLMPGNEAHLLAVLEQKSVAEDDTYLARFTAIAEPALERAETITLMLGTEFLRTASAHECLLWIIHNVQQLKKSGKKVTVQFLFDRPNQLGLWDMGCLPGVGPHWQPVAPPPSSRTVPDLVYALGADPLADCVRDDPCRLAALQTDCLVVHASHMTLTAQQAHVVLPAPSYGEENGTYTNNCGQPQAVKSVRPSQACDTFETLTNITEATANKLPPQQAEQLRHALSAQDVDPKLAVECQANDSSTIADPLVPPVPNSESPLAGQHRRLLTGDGQFQSANLSNHSTLLRSLGGDPYVEMNPGAGSAAASEGDAVTIICGNARFSARLKVNTGLDESVIFIPESYLIGHKDKFLSFGLYPAIVKVNTEVSVEIAVTSVLHPPTISPVGIHDQ